MQIETTSSEKESIFTSDLPLGLVSSSIGVSSLLDAASLFEIIGSKWMLAVPFEYWDEEIHEHCSDEVQHTKMVQDEARKLRYQMNDEDVLKELKLNRKFIESTELYLSRLSKKIFRLTLGAGRYNGNFSVFTYAIISFLIERRIMKIYPSIAKYGPTEEVRKMARTIISDEKKHLNFVGDRLPGGLEITAMNKQEIIEIEEELAQVWITSLLEAFNEV